MSEFKKPNIIDQEIILDPSKVIMSKTDKFGVLEFVNEYFVEVSGYEEYELMGKSIYCTQHPDMPDIIFKLLWEKLEKGENCNILVKNLSKSGKFYWSVTSFEFRNDEENNEITAIYNRRRAPEKSAIEFFEPLYKKLKKIENESGIEFSEKYLKSKLEIDNLTFEGLLSKYIGSNLSSPITKRPVISIIPPKPDDIIKEGLINEKTTEIPNPKKVEVVKNSKVEKTEVTKKTEVVKNKPKPVDVKESKNTQEVKTTKTEVKTIKPIEEPKKDLPTEVKKEKVVKKEIEIKNKAINLIQKTSDLNDSEKAKKSLFQKWFGKTEEEIEEERKRNKK